MRRIFYSVLAAALLLAPASARADYIPGRGLSVAGDALVIGGYVALNVHVLDQERDRLSLDDLSAFVSWQAARHLQFFGEFEFEDTIDVDRHRLHGTLSHHTLERLYAEWQPVDTLRVRVGKMLTPLGIWNPIHAAPLVWTVSRPITSDFFFDTGVTGATADVALLRREELEIVATVFGQVTGHLDNPGDVNRFRRAAGGRVAFDFLAAGPRFGVSYVRFDDKNDRRWESTYGADFFWALRFWELSSELSVNRPTSGATTWGMYVQAVYNAPWNLHPVLRVEHVDLGSVVRTPVVVGLAYKPTLNTIVKLETVLGGDETELGGDGVLASVAVLF